MTLNADLVRTRCGDIDTRNLLVHMYARVDPARLHGILRDHLEDLRAFARTVAGLL